MTSAHPPPPEPISPPAAVEQVVREDAPLEPPCDLVRVVPPVANSALRVAEEAMRDEHVVDVRPVRHVKRGLLDAVTAAFAIVAAWLVPLTTSYATLLAAALD